MRNVPRRSGHGQRIHPFQNVYAGQDIVGLGVLRLITPAIYGDGWVPVARLVVLWVMTIIIIIIILVRTPLPALPDLFGSFGN